MTPIQQGEAFRDQRSRYHAVFKCQYCNNNFISTICDIANGRVKSCKCRYHRMTNSPEYESWTAMKTRCLNENCPEYVHYGERGITICEEWLLSFKTFYADMGPRPEGTTLERIDNDGNYCPENCRWATAIDQGRNRRSTLNLTFRGETHCLEEWSIRSGIGQSTLSQRLKLGWSVEKALTTPNREGRKLL